MALSRLRSGRETDNAQVTDSKDGYNGAGGDPGDEPTGSRQDQEEESNLLVTSTVSVPEVSLVPSPEVSKVNHY